MKKEHSYYGNSEMVLRHIKKIDSSGSLDCYGLKAKDHTVQSCEPSFSG